MATTSYGVLVGYYPLDELNSPSLGTSITDSSGNAHDGIMVTDAVPGAGAIEGVASANAALYGTAYSFSSAPTDLGYVDINPSPAFTFLTRDGALTYAAWIKPAATQDFAKPTFIGTNGSAFDFRIAPSGSDWNLQLQSGNTPTSGLATAATIPSDAWTHVAVTKDVYDAGTLTANVGFYINGILAESGTVSRAGNGSTRRLFFGTGNAVDQYYNGGLDEVHVYNEVLDAATIAGLAGAALPLQGDYDQDSKVDASDYVVWRKDPTNPNYGGGGSAGYDLWRANYGSGVGSGLGSSQSVPEPATFALVGLLASLLIVKRHSRVEQLIVPHVASQRSH